ncbi:hypothetical protein [Micromonospora globbae]|uniref:hypothetical protein n=1 Tax=Micromonospora globbae TaxID=1894969 RepID=UPI00344820B9
MGRATAAAEHLEDALDDVTGSAKDATVAAGKAKDEVEDLGGAAKDTGQDLGRLRQDAERLDRQIDETTRGVRDLARAIAATSDEAERAKLLEKLGVEQGRLRQQVSIRRLIDFTDDRELNEQGMRIGARLADGVAQGFSTAGGPVTRALGNVFGTLPPQAQLGIGAALIGAATAAAPAIGAVVSGAVVGAAGAGGIVGGVALAAKDPRVAAAATDTGEVLSQALSRSASAFVPVTLDALGQVRGRVGVLEDDLERAFTSLARNVPEVADDFLAGAESAVDGFADAAERSGPILRTFGEIGREAGELVGDSLRLLAEQAPEAARALAALWGIFDLGTRAVVGTVAGLAEAYGWMEKVGALLSGDPLRMYALAASEKAAQEAGGGLSPELQRLIDKLTGTGVSANTAAVEVRTLGEYIDELTGKAISSEQAQSRLEGAIDAAAEAAKRNGDGIDANIPKQRANRDALIAIADAARTAADRILEETGSQEQAAAATERGRAKFLEVADAMGVSATEAKKLADRLFGIPASRTSTVKVLTDKATDEVIGFEKRLNQLDGRVVTVRTRFTAAGEYIPGVGTLTRRWGGITEHARDGLLREAAVYSPVAPARYAFAEPATGGEAFIPRFGDPDRSLGILQRAAKWYGAQVVPGGGAAAGGVQVIENHIEIGGEVVRVVRTTVAEGNRELRRRVSAGAGRQV